MSDARLGVFICDCGDRIASTLDLEALERSVRELPGVCVARRLVYSCSPDGIDAIVSTVNESELYRVLVAGCTPKLLQRHFQSALGKAGLNSCLFEVVDIREGCAWVHQDEPHTATNKALDLIQMGVARLTDRQPRHAVGAKIAPGAMVIGGGLAGMTAALTMANSGQQVMLVEREAELGGMLNSVHTMYPDRRDAGDLLAEKVEAVTHHPRIQVLLESRVTGVTGTTGEYTVDVNGGSSCFDVGAIIVATGARTLRPWGQFAYDGVRVVTQQAFERELRDTKPLSKVVMIMCAGQRNDEIPYCSGVCCVAGVKQAMELKAANPDAEVTILFRDLYLMGQDLYEKKVIEARRAGVQFVRYSLSSLPTVTAEGIEVHDQLTGRDMRLQCDRVVLATPLVPQADASVLANLLGITQDDNGFFPEVRYRLRPQDYAERGVYICGAAHSPVPWFEAVLQATVSAFKALRYLQSGQLSSNAPVAGVDEKLCTGCGNCVETCPFDAISMQKRDMGLDLSNIDSLKCTGCGNCVVVCPVKAISQPVTNDEQVMSQIDAVMATQPKDGCPRVLVFGCEWSSNAAAELAGAKKLAYPSEARLIPVRCSTRFDPIHILWALFSGADGVFLGACPPGDCHYIDGNRNAKERYDSLRRLLAQSGFDPRRLRLEWIRPDDACDFVTKITDFVTLVRALGPSPVKRAN
jgi:heterodisulfide reductase subunit A2